MWIQWPLAAILTVLFIGWTVRKLRSIRLEDKVVLITGGSRGLGLVLARECLRQGAKVAICGRDEETLDRAYGELLNQSAAVLAVRCDVTRHDEVRRAVHSVVGRFGGIDVLINNAGLIQVGPIDTMLLEDYDEAMRVHFWGPLYMIRAVLPEMRLRRAGHIVNIASVGGKIAVPHLVPYDASKFALAGLSQGLRAELAKDRIVVTTVYPGLMRTGSARNAHFKGRHRDEYAWFSAGASLPLLTVPAERAARRILSACRHGDAEVVLSFAAWFGVKVHGIFPSAVIAALAFVNRLLPASGGIGADRRKGAEIRSESEPSPWRALGDEAALRNNEVPPAEMPLSPEAKSQGESSDGTAHIEPRRDSS